MPFFNRRTYIEDHLHLILFNQQTIIKELQKMSTNPPVTQAQFTADLANLQTSLGGMITDVQTDIAAGTTPDFTSLDATVQAMASAVSTEDAAAKADQAPPAATVTESAEVHKA